MKINDEELGIMAEVASLYFEQNFSQQEIADKLYFSRSKVSRLLSKAIESKVVEITINYPLERIMNLEMKLKDIFELNEVIVIKDYSTTYEMLLKRLGNAAAQYLDGVIKDNTSMGITWGQTIYHIVEAMNANHHKNLRVIQLMGTTESDNNSAYDAPELVRKIVDKYGGSFSQFYSPLVVENELVRDSLVREPIIRKVLEEARQVDIVVTSIGHFSSRKIKAWEHHLDDAGYRQLSDKGAVGVLLAHFINQHGHLVDETLDQQVIGIKLEDLKQIKNVVAVAGGVNMAKGVYGAVKGGYVNTLIVDERLALGLLDLEAKQ